MMFTSSTLSDMANPPKVFFGPFEVEETENVGLTPEGKPVLRLHFKDRSITEVVPQHVFEAVATPAPIDFTALREKRYVPLIEAMTSAMLEHDIRYEDIQYVLNSVMGKCDAAFDRASNFLWTGNDKAWIPGAKSFYVERTLLEADAVLKKLQSDAGSKEQSPA